VKFYLTSCLYASNPDDIANLSAVVFNISDGTAGFNLTGEVKRDISKVKVSILFKVPSNPASNEYDKVLVKADADACKLEQGIFSNYLIRFITDQLKTYSNIKFECIQKKGPIFISNFPIVEMSQIPLFILKGREGAGRKWEVSVDIKGKDAKTKRITQKISLKLYGFSIF
jgi:Protein of unknown function (DUF1091)